MAKIKVTGWLETKAVDIDHFVDINDLEKLQAYIQNECEDVGLSELRDIKVERMD